MIGSRRGARLAGGPARLLMVALIALAGLLAALVAAGSAQAVASAPASPTAPSASTAVTLSPGATAPVTLAPKGPLATYGIGPASTTKVDGRSSFQFFASPGATSSDHVAILNISAQPLTLNVYASDAVNSSSGALSYQPRSVKAVDAGAWVHIHTASGTSSITVKGRSTTILPFTVDIPNNASPGDHTGGVAVSLSARIAGPSTKNETFDQSVAVPLFIRVSGPIHATLAVTKLSARYHSTVNPGGAGSVTVHYSVRNSGNVNLGGHQQVTVSGIFGAKHIAVADVPLLLPGASEPITVQVPNVWPQLLIKGTVHVVPVSTPGDVNPTLIDAAASTTVWAVPWSALGIVLIVVVLGLAWWWLRRRAPRPSAHAHARSKSRRHRRLGEATS